MATPDYVGLSNRISRLLANHAAKATVVSKDLISAGEMAQQALGLLLDDPVFWQSVGTQPAQPAPTHSTYSEPILKYYEELLVRLGHVEPPPARNLVDDVRSCILQNRANGAAEQKAIRQ